MKIIMKIPVETTPSKQQYANNLSSFRSTTLLACAGLQHNIDVPVSTSYRGYFIT